MAGAGDVSPNSDDAGLPAFGRGASPETLRRRRQAIALMLERTLPYRTLYDVKLVNAKLAGPFEYT